MFRKKIQLIQVFIRGSFDKMLVMCKWIGWPFNLFLLGTKLKLLPSNLGENKNMNY